MSICAVHLLSFQFGRNHFGCHLLNLSFSVLRHYRYCTPDETTFPKPFSFDRILLLKVNAARNGVMTSTTYNICLFIVSFPNDFSLATTSMAEREYDRSFRYWANWPWSMISTLACLLRVILIVISSSARGIIDLH